MTSIINIHTRRLYVPPILEIEEVEENVMTNASAGAGDVDGDGGNDRPRSNGGSKFLLWDEDDDIPTCDDSDF